MSKIIESDINPKSTKPNPTLFMQLLYSMTKYGPFHVQIMLQCEIQTGSPFRKRYLPGPITRKCTISMFFTLRVDKGLIYP